MCEKWTLLPDWILQAKDQMQTIVLLYKKTKRGLESALPAMIYMLNALSSSMQDSRNHQAAAICKPKKNISNNDE